MNRYQSESHVARDAFTVQDACNLSGIAYAFCDAVEYLKSIGKSAEEIADHPSIVVWVDKLEDLSRARRENPFDSGMDIFGLCQQLRTTMENLCQYSNDNGKGTDWRNQNPFAQHVVSALVHLCKSRSGFTQAYDANDKLRG